MTDEEIWDFLVKNEKLAHWFSIRAVGHSKSKYFVSYLWEAAFKIIKSGGLEKGNISTVFNYATLASLRLWVCKEASKGICIPTGMYQYKKAIQKGLDNGDDCIYYGPNLCRVSSSDARTLMVAVSKRKKGRIEIDDNTTSVNPIPDLHIVHNTELDTDWDRYADIDDWLRYLTEFFTKKLQKRNAENTWKDSKRAKASLYCLGRRYGIETRVMRLAPEIYGLGKEYDLVTPYIKDVKEMAKRVKASEKGVNVKVEFEHTNYKTSTIGDTSLETIGEELGVTRERVRQHVAYLEKILSEYVS